MLSSCEGLCLGPWSDCGAGAGRAPANMKGVVSMSVQGCLIAVYQVPHRVLQGSVGTHYSEAHRLTPRTSQARRLWPLHSYSPGSCVAAGISILLRFLGDPSKSLSP